MSVSVSVIIISKCLYSCQMNSDLYETGNISFWGLNWLFPHILVIPFVLSGPFRALYSPSKVLYIPINLPNELWSFLTLNSREWGFNQLIPLMMVILSVLSAPSLTLCQRTPRPEYSIKSPQKPYFIKAWYSMYSSASNLLSWASDSEQWLTGIPESIQWIRVWRFVILPIIAW